MSGWIWLSGMLAGVSGASLAGCQQGAGGPPGWVSWSGPESDATGLWRDLDPAVRRAATRHELAVTRILQQPDSGTRLYELHGIRGEDAWLKAGADESPEHWTDPVALVLQMQIGRLGDPEREAAFMESVREELGRVREGRTRRAGEAAG